MRKASKPLEQFVAEIVSAFDKGYELNGRRGDMFYSDLYARMKREYGNTEQFQAACKMLEAKKIFIHS